MSGPMLEPDWGAIGIVVIGRNEGARLVACFDSLPMTRCPIIYVDSGSTDQSVAEARARGVWVHQLKGDRPYSAARARNAGLNLMSQRHTQLRYVQFIDGDCTLDNGWLPAAYTALEADNSVAVVCGRRRERDPEGSIYNRLADIEWDTPTGEALACGGDALMRLNALNRMTEAAGPFDERFAAGEEPELCYRLRQDGWHILRLDREMTRHDIDMHQFDQWWQRMVRSGGAYAQSVWVHGRGAERFKLKETISIWLYAALIPLLTILLLPLFGWWGLLLPLGWYSVAGWRILRDFRRRTDRSLGDAFLYTGAILVGKFPHLQGQIRFLRHRQSRLLEYKKG